MKVEWWRGLRMCEKEYCSLCAVRCLILSQCKELKILGGFWRTWALITARAKEFCTDYRQDSDVICCCSSSY